MKSSPQFPQLRVGYIFGSFLTRDDFRDIDIALFPDERLSEKDRGLEAENVGFCLEESLGLPPCV